MMSKNDVRPEISGAGSDSDEAIRPAATPAFISDEDRGRAALYGLLASGLEAPTGTDWLSIVGTLEAGEGPVGAALGELAGIARRADPVRLRRDYHDLFIGVGRGELVPYGSFYLTGFLNEKPLALLRADMRRLGIVRDPSVREPEDHVAAECQMMAGLLLGGFGTGAPGEASRFYRAHLAAWVPYFFKDLAASSTGELYPAIGRLGRAFFEVEAELDTMFEGV